MSIYTEGAEREPRVDEIGDGCQGGKADLTEREAGEEESERVFPTARHADTPVQRNRFLVSWRRRKSKRRTTIMYIFVLPARGPSGFALG